MPSFFFDYGQNEILPNKLEHLSLAKYISRQNIEYDQKQFELGITLMSLINRNGYTPLLLDRKQIFSTNINIFLSVYLFISVCLYPTYFFSLTHLLKT